MALVDLTADHEYIIRCVLVDSARDFVTALNEIDPGYTSTYAYLVRRLREVHEVYETLTGSLMDSVHREGTTFVAR